ncbi:anhydro-N-acetylmuramic acid kinase [Terrihabitans sp. B22-R8]|uniref:anhydro-N-acetylmuramic acid kinase n=1 Tax=Terrihabitans sp. B22-R8 TaxID=3425128 RepID=UPI00403C044B
MRAVGMMSGTSLDGIDIALIETDGETITGFGQTASFPYDGHAEDRRLIFAAMEDARDLTDRTARPGRLLQAEDAVNRLNIEAVQAFLTRLDKPADIIGFHGQTMVHRPEIGLTLQLGNGQAMARKTGVPVAYDFRAADMQAGGEGAPLAPVFHAALAKTLDRSYPICVLNLGGVANITFIEAEGAEPLACDVGPANALVDDFMRERTGRNYDDLGRSAAAGQIDQRIVENVLSHPFFRQKPPKSLDRNAFRQWINCHASLGSMTVEDGSATLTAFTVAGIVSILKHLPRAPRTWIVVGGGAHNLTIMDALREQLAPAWVGTGEDVGWLSDYIEAQAFAFLAARSLRGLPLSFPGTTGVPVATPGGLIGYP